MTDVAALLERAQDVIAFERKRADDAEAERDALADSLGTLVASAATAERERITALAESAGAITTQGTQCFFADLIRKGSHA